MRLRTRLGLGFAAVAALPLLALTVPARRALSSAVEEALSARLDGAARAAELALGSAARQAERAASELSHGEPLITLAQARANGDADPAQTAELAAALMSGRGIDVLELLDARGQVLSSGHLPGRVGDDDPQGLAIARAGAATLGQVEVKRGSGIATTLALLAGAQVGSGPSRVFVLAGKQLDPPFAQRLAALTGAEAQIASAGIPTARSSPPLSGPHLRERVVSLPPGKAAGTLTLRLSAEGLYAAEGRLWRSVAWLALLALGLAALLGWGFAARVTQPVDALAQGAQALARGERSHRVQARASGEVGELVRTFNAMAQDLQTTTERAAVAERIAAWQEVARRLAHEIKNPLTPIRMSMETLQQALAQGRADFAEIFAESSHAILEEVDRLKRIIDEFSRFARLPRPVLETLNLDELVDQVLALYAGSALQLTRASGQVPPVRADRDQLTQVLVNLLQNADQAMPSGGPCTVTTRLLQSGEVALEVSDAGPGVPKAERAQIFEPYVTTKPGGSGLGLAIAARILAEHGGRIEVDDAPGGGARFRVVLPQG